MKNNFSQIKVFKQITSSAIFCLLFANNIIAQNPTVNDRDINSIRQQLQRTKTDTSKARLSTQLSTAFIMLTEIDSCKKYASIGIDLTTKILAKNNSRDLTSKYKTIQAKAIENFGSALAFENAIKAIDTLQVSLQMWKELGNKDEIAITYFSIAQAYGFKSNQIEAIDNYNKGLALFKETKNKEYEAASLYAISLEKRYLGMFGDALEYSIKSLKVAEQIKDTTLITDALLGNSFNYMLAKNYPEALQEQKKALRLYEMTKDSVGIARTYNDMGVTDMFAGKLDEALAHHKKALELRKKVSDANDIGISYNYLATIYRRQGKLNEALAAIKEGIQYNLQFGDSRFIMDAYMETGDIYYELKDYDNAIANYNLALDVAKRNNSQNYQAKALMLLGKTFNAKGNLKQALSSLQKADNIVLPNDYKTRKNIYEVLTQTYLTYKDYKSAYHNQLKFIQVKDSVDATEKADKITKLTQQLIYENNRALQKASQDKEIAIKESQIKEQKYIRNLSIVGFLIVGILAFVFFWRFKEKRKLNIALQTSLNELKTTQKQLIQSEKMASLGELTAGVAHEIQNPLNFVNNFSELSNELIDEMNAEIEKGDLEEAKFIAKDIKENLGKIHHHGKRAEAIVKGMLQHSRGSSETKEPTDINKLADEYLRLAYHGLRAKDKSFNANLETDFDESIGSINAIPQDLGRVLLNLITNAFYVVDEKQKAGIDDYKPTVKVSTKKLKDKITISVKDNGHGIPKHVLDKIFQPFFTTKPTGQGTGLGLSMSYDIITKGHGGELTVDTKEGEGTTFNIELPLNS
ncbi:MAG: tetratricopeptide repeat protein [Gelidibacter sp.]